MKSTSLPCPAKRASTEQRQNCKAAGFDFVPLAFEATGGHSKKVDQVAHYLLQQKQIYLGVPFEESTPRFWQLISVTVWSSNAFAITRCLKEMHGGA